MNLIVLKDPSWKQVLGAQRQLCNDPTKMLLIFVSGKISILPDFSKVSSSRTIVYFAGHMPKYKMHHEICDQYISFYERALEELQQENSVKFHNADLDICSMYYPEVSLL